MEVGVYQRATFKSKCIDACESTNSIFIMDASHEAACKGIEILVENDIVFRQELIDLLRETRKRLQKEFDEL